MLSNWKT